jgi:hypothetical protein
MNADYPEVKRCVGGDEWGGEEEQQWQGPGHIS